MMKNKNSNIFSLTEIAICTSLLCISAYLIIPLPVIPITLQFFAIVLIALLLKPTHTLTSVSLYIMLGVVGLPVFSGGKSGFGALLSPTGGFIIGFLVSAFLISLFKGKNLTRNIIVSVLCGIIPTYTFGIGFFMLFTDSDLLTAVTSVGFVFIFIDIAKCIFASIIAKLTKNALKKSKIAL